MNPYQGLKIFSLLIASEQAY